MDNQLYCIWLELGNLFHVLANEDDAERGADILEPIMEKLERLWRASDSATPQRTVSE